MVWLIGPPGAGKGYNLHNLRAVLGIQHSITMSEALEADPAACAVMRSGDLVSDTVAASALLRATLCRRNHQHNVPAHAPQPQRHHHDMRITAALQGSAQPTMHSQLHSAAALSSAPQQADGLIVDGFPRTHAQVQVIRDLQSYFTQVCAAPRSLPRRPALQPPKFQAVILDVDEETSVRRQQARHAEAVAHNAIVRTTGAGQLLCAPPCSPRLRFFRQC